MCNRLLSGQRYFVLLAVVASLALTPVRAGAKDRLTPTIENPQPGQGVQRVDPNAEETIGTEPPAPFMYARSNYIWPYAQVPPYGTATGSRLHDQGMLRTLVGAIPIDELRSRLPIELQSTDRIAELGLQYFIIDLDRQWMAEGGAQELAGLLASTGSTVVGGMPATAIVARLNQAGMNLVETEARVNAVAAYPPALKLHPAIGRRSLANPIKALSNVYDLDIQVFPGEDAMLVAADIIALGGEVTGVAGTTIHASMDRAKLSALASIQAIATIAELIANRLASEETTITMQTGGFQGRGTIGPYHLAGVNGSGNGVSGTSAQILLVVDSGIQLDAADLANDPSCTGTACDASPTHRKVVAYRPASDYGGIGDDQGCDAGPQGGNTHGHIVSATAVGNATNIVDSATWNSTTTFTATDTTENAWALDGVAPGAKMTAVDANMTPQATSCNDPIVAGVTIGPNYYTGIVANDNAVCPGATCPGFLQATYRADTGNGGDDARVVNLSYGSANGYPSDARQIDNFLYDKRDAMLFAAAGNSGLDFDNDGFPDLGSVIAPSTNRNGISVGATLNAALADSAETRAGFSSIGPARVGAVPWELDPANSKDRVQPILMAPGADVDGLGLISEFVCRTLDNDGDEPIQCDITDGNAGTSFASPAAAGAALLMRDYFAQGFYPTGVQVDANKVANISGSLVKALSVASADFLNGVGTPTLYRFNNEQGYGRIQLDNVLPLQTWAPSVSGLIVADGGIPGGKIDLSGLDGVLNGLVAGEEDSQTFTVCNTDEELRVALVWMDKPNATDAGTLQTDLDLELVAPGGSPVYYGNYFTDDDNRDKVVDTAGADAEDCPDHFGNTGNVDSSQWSLKTCTRASLTLSPHDVANNTEAIFLTPDLDNDNDDDIPDADPSDDTQIVAGTWTVKVKVKDTNPDGTAFIPDPDADVVQRYAVVISGGACLGASVRFDEGSYVCNAQATVSVNELSEGGSNPTEAAVSARTTVEVIPAGGGAAVDTETGLTFTQAVGTQEFDADPLFLTDQTARDPGNGVLDVRDGDTLRVTYDDAGDGAATPDQISESSVNCQLRITSGAITFGQFGFDTGIAVNGGCERNARGLFEFGFPDRYLDEDELIILSVAIGSQESETINDMSAALRCVEANDSLAPETCQPGTTDCANPNRTIAGGHVACPASEVDITNSPIVVESLPANSAIGINYNLVMGSTIPDKKEVEFVLELSSPTSGKGGVSVAVFRALLDADALAVLYSTDFPTGGTEFADWNNNELLEGDTSLALSDPSNIPTADLADFHRDYRFETRVFADMTTTGKNADVAAGAPWNFDLNDGGFLTGIAAPTDDDAISDTIAQWGEDKNFNDLMDGFCSIGTCNIGGNACADPLHCPLAGDFCRFDAQGWCGGVPLGTQCTDTDDPGDPDLIPEDCEGDVNGFTCDLITCNDNFGGTCNVLSGIPRCKSESEDRDPQDFKVTNVWNTSGGCGWQTAVAGVCNGAGGACYIDADCAGSDTCTATAPKRGLWHTGRIGTFGATGCLGAGNTVEQCQGIETVGGDEGERLWFELLMTPEMEKVDASADSVNILNFAWNQAIDLEDSNVAWTWEIDGDLDAIKPVDLTSDGNILNIGFGGYTPRGGADGTSQNNPHLTNGFSMFAPVTDDPPVTDNGTIGVNRHGRNACYLEGTFAEFPPLTLKEFGWAGPLDDDLNNGHCPGDLARMCVERCVGGTEDGADCSTADAAASAVCTGGGGACVANSASQIHNDCDVSLTCNGSSKCEDTFGNVLPNPFTCSTAADCYTCVFANSMIDEYVKPNGPIRNMDITAFNGPDLRFITVEDVAGKTKNRFQAAIGIVNFEKIDPSSEDPATSYGIGVDDVVVEWQEISLVVDATDCATGGSCANLDTSVGTTFNSATFLDITLQDQTPSPNDCNDDGDNTDSGVDTKDCNGNGIPDVRVTGKSENEPAGERLTLDCRDGVVDLGADCVDNEYFGSLPVSATYDSPGVVFVQAQGVGNPVVEINYFDYDDGAGNVCQNNLLAEALGLVRSFTEIVLTGGDVTLIDTQLTDNGDGDIWADTNETVDMIITLRNRTGIQLNNVQARLATSDPRIDCILDTIINIPVMEPDNPATTTVDEGITTSTDAFQFRVAATADRLGTCSVGLNACGNDTQCTAGGGDSCNAELLPYSATMNVFLSSDEFDTALVDQVVTLALDLDATGGGLPIEVIEGFEVTGPGQGDLGIFEIHNIDSLNPADGPGGPVVGIAGLGGNGGSLANSDGYRCSYADPDHVWSFTWQDEDCFMGADGAHADKAWWNVHTERAFAGTQSLAYTEFIDATLGFTTPTGVLEAVETTAPISLGYKRICSDAPTVPCTTATELTDCGGAGLCVVPQPRASWKHQISLLDFRTVGASGPRRSADGGVIHVQLADPATLGPSSPALGDWIKVEPVVNQYDSQREDNYNVCSFDPVDDGNDEDDFFDPTDPFRRFGPSSTCFPEFVYTYIGDTDSDYCGGDICLGNAVEGPGLEGSVGLGTWVESAVDLKSFRGQYVRIRMLVTALKVGTTWFDQFNYENTIPGDDGWFIDDFRVEDAITTPADLDGDIKNLTLPGCGAICTSVTAALVADPSDPLAAPGQLVELNAFASSGSCLGGVLQYRFWIDSLADGGTLGDDPGDELVRNWSENPLLLQALSDDTRYGVDVRCSSLTTCSGTAYRNVEVDCPSSAVADVGTVTADGSGSKNNFQWTAGTIAYAYAEGDLTTLSSSYVTSTTGTSTAAGHTITTGGSVWVLFRTDTAGGGGFCNSPGPGSWGSAARDAVLP